MGRGHVWVWLGEGRLAAKSPSRYLSIDHRVSRRQRSYRPGGRRSRAMAMDRAQVLRYDAKHSNAKLHESHNARCRTPVSRYRERSRREHTLASSRERLFPIQPRGAFVVKFLEKNA